MSNNTNPNYFRLGVFVLAAIGILIAVILTFGSGKFFKQAFYLETYIKQSVTRHKIWPHHNDCLRKVYQINNQVFFIS